MSKPANQKRRVVIRADEIIPENVGGVIQIQGGITKTTPCAYLSLDNNTLKTPTVLPIANTYLPISGVFTTQQTVEFTAVGGVLTYTGTEDISLNVNANWSWEIADGKSEEFTMCLDKNGSVVAGSEILSYLDDTNNYPRAAGLCCLCPVSTGDILTLKVKCNSNLESCIISYANLVAVGL
jgi:hypothetical protein